MSVAGGLDRGRRAVDPGLCGQPGGHGPALVEAVGSFGVGGVERELATLLDQSPRPVVDRLGRIESDPGMTVVIVVVCEEAAQEDTGVVES